MAEWTSRRTCIGMNIVLSLTIIFPAHLIGAHRSVTYCVSHGNPFFPSVNASVYTHITSQLICGKYVVRANGPLHQRVPLRHIKRQFGLYVTTRTRRTQSSSSCRSSTLQQAFRHHAEQKDLQSIWRAYLCIDANDCWVYLTTHREECAEALRQPPNVGQEGRHMVICDDHNQQW